MWCKLLVQYNKNYSNLNTIGLRSEYLALFKEIQALSIGKAQD